MYYVKSLFKIFQMMPDSTLRVLYVHREKNVCNRNNTYEYKLNFPFIIGISIC